MLAMVTVTGRATELAEVPLTVRVAAVPSAPCELFGLNRMAAALASNVSAESSGGRTVRGFGSSVAKGAGLKGRH